MGIKRAGKTQILQTELALTLTPNTGTGPGHCPSEPETLLTNRQV